ncbi:MAG: tetratricopeptide repeat protein [Planctomycetota bacterium]
MRRDRSKTLTTTTALIALVAIGVGTLASGCSSSSRSEIPPPAERLRKAGQLADRAETALREEDVERAIELYQESVSTSGTVSNWNNLGILLMDQNNFAGAVSAFRRAAELEPTDPRPLTNVGIAFYRAGWADDAVRHFDLALEVSPNYLPALRGSAAATAAASRADEKDLDRVTSALLYESDPRWRSYFERRRSVVEATIREAERRRVPGE